MAEINYYKSNQSKKYLGTIDITNSSNDAESPLFICLLDKSGSMGDNVYVYVKEIFPLVLEKLKCDKQENILITYEDKAQEYSGNADFFRNQNITSDGGTQLHVGLSLLEKKIDEYIKSNTKKQIRLLTISDGDVGNLNNLFKSVDNLINKTTNNFMINSHVVRYFTSDSPPDTKGLSSMLK